MKTIIDHIKLVLETESLKKPKLTKIQKNIRAGIVLGGTSAALGSGTALASKMWQSFYNRHQQL